MHGEDECAYIRAVYTLTLSQRQKQTHIPKPKKKIWNWRETKWKPIVNIWYKKKLYLKIWKLKQKKQENKNWTKKKFPWAFDFLADTLFL